MGFDGIPAGTIRSPRGNSDFDAKIDPERWCATFGHKWKQFSDGEACLTCWKERAKSAKEPVVRSSESAPQESKRTQ
jgi:hypothetical protein